MDNNNNNNNRDKQYHQQQQQQGRKVDQSNASQKYSAAVGISGGNRTVDPRRGNILSPIRPSNSPFLPQGLSPLSDTGSFSLDPNAASFAPTRTAAAGHQYISPIQTYNDSFSDTISRLSLGDSQSGPGGAGYQRPPRSAGPSTAFSPSTGNFPRSPQPYLAPGQRQSQIPPPITTGRSYPQQQQSQQHHQHHQQQIMGGGSMINSPTGMPPGGGSGGGRNMQSIWQQGGGNNSSSSSSTQGASIAYQQSHQQATIASPGGFAFSTLTPAPGFLDYPMSAIEPSLSSAHGYEYPSPGGFESVGPRTPASAFGSYGLFTGRHPVPLGTGNPGAQSQQSQNVNEVALRSAGSGQPRTPVTPAMATSPALTVAPINKGSFVFPARPPGGLKGRKIRVRANFFEFITIPGKKLYHYDIKITPEVPPSLNRRIFKEMMMKYGGKELGRAMAVFDGRRNIYTPIPIQAVEDSAIMELDVFITDEHSSNSSVSLSSKKSSPAVPSPPRKFCVRLKQCPMIDMDSLKDFVESTIPTHSPPFDALQALDILMRHRPSMLLTTVGRSFFTRNDAKPLGDGAECWMGFHQSVRPAQGKMVINIDVSATAFFEPGPILQFISKNLGKKSSDDLINPLRHREIEKCERLLKGVKIQVNHRGDIRRKYKIHGFTRTAADQTYFKYTRTVSAPVESSSLSLKAADSMFLSKSQVVVAEGEEIEVSVAEYFFKQYNYTLRFPYLPCLRVGNTNRTVFLPLEVCDIVPGQRFLRKLNESQTAQMIRLTCQTPDRRANKIASSIGELGLTSLGVNAVQQPDLNPSMIFDPEDEAYLNSFGVQISDEMMAIPARVLDPPTVQYHQASREPIITPREGSWNLRDKKVVQPATLQAWSVVCFGTPREMPQHKIDHFLRELIHTCRDTGLNITNPHPPAIYGDPASNIEATLQAAWQNAGESTQSYPQLILCILPNTGVPLYAEIKRVGDTVLGVPTQCVQVKHTFQPKKQYCANVCLKINSKLGGVNSYIVKNPHNNFDEGLPWIGECPTIIFGADVTHPAHGESRTAGSVCALVGSLDRMASRYAATVRLQPPRKEIIMDLSSMVQEILRIFYSENNQISPQRILFYRDGLSESQFFDVAVNELQAIREACERIQPGYKPRITYVVVQKRHHARVFAMNPKDADRSGNIPAGTVIDSHITHPNEYDFYLCSHAGLQGTSRPTHYHVLHDENNLAPDVLQDLTYRLCYSYARCTRSVSVVPPAYYADLVAFRAKYHMKSSMLGWSTTGSISGKEESIISGGGNGGQDRATTASSEGAGGDGNRGNEVGLVTGQGSSVTDDDDSQSRNGRRRRKDAVSREEEEEMMRKLQSKLAKVKPELQRVMYFM